MTWFFGRKEQVNPGSPDNSSSTSKKYDRVKTLPAIHTDEGRLVAISSAGKLRKIEAANHARGLEDQATYRKP